MSAEIGKLKLVSVDELPRMLKHTENAVDAKTLAQSKQIVDAVRNRGIDGLIEHSVRLGDLKSKTQSIEVSKEEMRNAYHKLPKEQRGALQRMADRIRSFAKAYVFFYWNSHSHLFNELDIHTTFYVYLYLPSIPQAEKFVK